MAKQVTEFQKAVYKAIKKIPKGRVATYKDVAQAVGSPKAIRAVGNALNKNPNAPHVPCHRVVKNNGETGGYGGGIDKKIKLLKSEGVMVLKNRICNFDKIRYNFS